MGCNGTSFPSSGGYIVCAEPNRTDDNLIAWQNARSRLNHDWLRNRYITALGTRYNIAVGLVDDPAFEQYFQTVLLPEWGGIKHEISSLIKSAESILTPSILFERTPLNRCSSETRSWLRPLLHQLWCVRTGIQSWCSMGLAALADADECFSRVQVLLKCADEGISDNVLLAQEIQRLSAACIKLGTAITNLPSSDSW